MTTKPTQRITGQMCIDVLRKDPNKSFTAWNIAETINRTATRHAVVGALRKPIKEGLVKTSHKLGWEILYSLKEAIK